MNEQAFATLEFDSLRALVRRSAQTDMGRARVDALAPAGDLHQLLRALDALAESIALRQHAGRNC